MMTAVSKHPLVAFFLLAFPLSWIAVLPLVLNPAQAPEPYLILGALAGPTLSALTYSLAALVVVIASRGRLSFRDQGIRIDSQGVDTQEGQLSGP